MPHNHIVDHVTELEDAFIKVTFEDEEEHSSAFEAEHSDRFYQPWTDQASAKFSYPLTFGAVQLRKLYPKHSLVLLSSNVDMLNFPGALIQPMAPHELITTVRFNPSQRRDGQGILFDEVELGSFRVAWNASDFILYIVKFPQGAIIQYLQYFLHEGSEENSRALIRAAGLWADEMHDEILVYNQAWWKKDHGLWLDVQKADWEDVILKEELKTNVRKDVLGFYESEDLYKKLAIPWKRGIIMYGPPGNGKTISIKAIMKDSLFKGYPVLYVKSFQSWKGEEGAMEDVFSKARQMAPCMLVLEDLDALITDRNRSFFLNQLDGLQSNDGLLVIGTTNHLERLDPALRDRPSRFDRKYNFPDPDWDERALYAKYWQKKLADNKEIEYPDILVDEVADNTAKFSFAYLKEAFVSSLVTLAGFEEQEKPSFRSVLLNQIKILRKQLDKDSKFGQRPITRGLGSLPLPPTHSFGGSARPGYAADPRVAERARIWGTSDFVGSVRQQAMPGEMPSSGPEVRGESLWDRRTNKFQLD